MPAMQRHQIGAVPRSQRAQVLRDRGLFEARDGGTGVDERPRQKLESPGGQLFRLGLFHVRERRSQRDRGHVAIVHGDVCDQIG